MNNYLNFNTHKQVAFEYRNASKGFIGDTSKMLAPALKKQTFLKIKKTDSKLVMVGRKFRPFFMFWF